MSDFGRYGMQILQQAHIAAMCLAAPSATVPVNLHMFPQQQFS